MTTSSIILKSMTLKPITPLMSPALWIATCLTLLLIACGGGGKVTPPPPPTTYVLTVNSASPASRAAAISPAHLLAMALPIKKAAIILITAKNGGTNTETTSTICGVGRPNPTSHAMPPIR